MNSDIKNKDSESETENSIFSDINADDENSEVTEIESLCLQCGQNGITKILLTKIPFYKEVVIMSFFCKHCLWENNELQPATTIQEKGVLFTVQVQDEKDLARQIVRTRWASVIIPELDFEIPSQSQEGTITNIEGILDRTCCGLSSKLKELQLDESSSAKQIDDFLTKFKKLKEDNLPFTLIVRDATGNSYVENLCAPKNDPQLEVTHFERSREENLMIGIYSEEDKAESESDASDKKPENLNDEVLCFPTNCYSCNAPCVTNMKITQIPHFKEAVIMATSCDLCGHNTNEVKSGSGIEPLGVRIALKISDIKDLSRDLLKSDTCSIEIPDIELEVGANSLKGCYTTVEGILSSIKSQLKESNPWAAGDSAEPGAQQRMKDFLQLLDDIMTGKRTATLILDDPCGNSYLQSIYYPNPDDSLTVERYTRTKEQDEELGLLDMKVENYEEES